MAISDITNRADAAHLLRRAGFGGDPGEITALTGRSRGSCVDAVMGFRSTDSIPLGPDIGVPAFVTRVRQWDSQTAVIDWWVQRMVALPNPTTVPASIPTVASPNPLQEKMTLFSHDHFACSQDKVSDIPAMLVYLDNQSNVVGSEQENYARELMELHTIGIGEFAENDVIAMARAWTGHNTVGWTGSRWDSTYVYKPDEHDQSVKTLFGITANWNGLVHSAGEREVMAEFIDGVRRRATARFISRKILRWSDGRVCRSPTWACTGTWKAWVRCC